MTPEQHQKNRIAKRIPAKWPITRRIKTSRGLGRNRNECYRLSSLQTLLHLPKFMNWVLSHPDCNQKDTDCFTCHLKTLIKAYWGKENLDNQDSPLAFAVNDPMIAPIHRHTRRWFQEAYGRSDRGAADGQQDAEDFVKRVIQTCQFADPNSQIWEDQFSALWQLTLEERRLCSRCGLYETRDEDHLGLASEVLHPLNTSGDTLIAMINRHLAGGNWPDTGIHRRCSRCELDTQHKNNYLIKAAPTHLMCSLSMSYFDDHGMERKNMHGHHYPMILDLTNHQVDASEPLRYKLQGVVAHQGRSAHEGHYVATVRGYSGKGSGSHPRGTKAEKRNARGKPTYRINDDVVTRRDESFLTTNPSEGFQTAVLVYSRMENPSPKSTRREGVARPQQQPNKLGVRLYELRWD